MWCLCTASMRTRWCGKPDCELSPGTPDIPPKAYDSQIEYENPLSRPAKYDLSTCLKELLFGRPASAQRFIQILIALVENFESENKTKF